MSKAVSANEAKNRLGSLLRYVNTEDGEVIVESHGKPKAVIMSFAAFQEVQELREEKRRADALIELRALREEVQARSRTLSDQDADELAAHVSREIVDDLVSEGAVSFERDAE
jgi:prevent-host-death family protein